MIFAPASDLGETTLLHLLYFYIKLLDPRTVSRNIT